MIGMPSAVFMLSYAPSTIGDDGRATGHGTALVVEPEKWPGRPFPLFTHIETSAPLREGRWTLLFYHHDCARCQDAISRLKQVAHRSRNDPSRGRFALIEVPPRGSPPIMHTGDADLQYGHLDDTRSWFIPTPLEVALDRGVVIALGARDEPDLNHTF